MADSVGQEVRNQKRIVKEKRNAIREVQQAVSKGIEAEEVQRQTQNRSANRIRNNSIRRERREMREIMKAQATAKLKEESSKKQLTGAKFLIMLFILILKDVMDILITLTGVGIPISVASSGAVLILLGFYYRTEKVKPGIKKIVTWILTASIEFIPIVNAIFPAYTINLLLTRKLTNNEKLGSVLGAQKSARTRPRRK